MAKIVGWILMLLGLALIVLGVLKMKIVSFLSPILLDVVGIILILIGFLFLKQRVEKQAKEEVPIYEGEGKKRRIVGYRRIE